MSLSEKLEMIITANADGAIKGFRNVGEAAEEHLGKASTGLDKTGAGMVKYGAGMVAAAGVVGGGLFEVSKKWEEAALTAGKMADATGLTSEQASRWAVVAKGADVDTAAFEKSVGFMNKTLGNSPDKFKEAGVAVEDLNGKALPTNDVLLNVIDRLNGIQDPAEKAATGARLLGKGWQSMAELIGEGSGKLTESLAAVSKQQVFDDKQVNDAKDYRDSLKELGNAVNGLVMAIGKGAAPVFGELAKVLTTVVHGFESIDAVTGGALGKFATLGAVVVAGAGALSMLGGALIKVRGVFVETTAAGEALTVAEAEVTAGAEAATAANEGLTVAEAEATAGAEEESTALSTVGKASVVALAAMAAYAVTKGIQNKQHADEVKFLAASEAAMLSLSDSTLSAADVMDRYRYTVEASAAAGHGLDEANKDLAQSNLEGAKRTLEVLKANGASKEITDSLASAVENQTVQEQNNAEIKLALRAESERLAGVTSMYQDRVAGLTGTMQDNSEIADRYRGFIVGLNDAHQKDADTTAMYQDRMKALTPAIDANVRVTSAAEQATRDLADAQERSKRLAEQQKQGWDDLNTSIDNDKAILSLKDSFDDLNKAGSDAMEAVKNKTPEAQEKLRAYQEKVDSLKESVLDYSKGVGAIPIEWATKINAEIDKGDLATAEAQLSILARNRTMQLSLDVKGATGSFTWNGGVGTPHAAGGTVGAGENFQIINEEGPEAVKLPTGSTVMTAAATKEMYGTGTTNNYFNVTTGADPNQVIQIIKRYTQNGGQL